MNITGSQEQGKALISKRTFYSEKESPLKTEYWRDHNNNPRNRVGQQHYLRMKKSPLLTPYNTVGSASHNNYLNISDPGDLENNNQQDRGKLPYEASVNTPGNKNKEYKRVKTLVDIHPDIFNKNPVQPLLMAFGRNAETGRYVEIKKIESSNGLLGKSLYGLNAGGGDPKINKIPVAKRTLFQVMDISIRESPQVIRGVASFLALSDVVTLIKLSLEIHKIQKKKFDINAIFNNIINEKIMQVIAI